MKRRFRATMTREQRMRLKVICHENGIRWSHRMGCLLSDYGTITSGKATEVRNWLKSHILPKLEERLGSR